MKRSQTHPAFRRRAVTLAAAALLTTTLAACGSSSDDTPEVGDSWDDIVAKAADEGTVSLYSAQAPQTVERIADCFRKEYPDISIDVVRGTSGDLLTRVDQERASGSDGADVWVTTELAWFKSRSEEDALLEPRGPAKESWPSEYLDGPTVIGGVEPLVISYNTDLVKNAPTGYDDLVSSDFKGKLGTSELAATVISAWYQWLEDNQSGFLKDLAAKKPGLYVGSVPISQAVASGEIAASTYGIPTAVQPLIDEGAPIKYVVPEPSFGVSYGIGALGWAKQPNGALVLLDFLMSPVGQQCWHGSGESASPLPDIKGALDIKSMEPWKYSDFSEDDERKLTDTWNKLFRG